jgi:hypothetical protein
LGVFIALSLSFRICHWTVRKGFEGEGDLPIENQKSKIEIQGMQRSEAVINSHAQNSDAPD